MLQWLESEAGAESYTFTEEMKEISDNFTIERLKQKLQEHYKEFIFFVEVEGCSNVVYFKNMAKYICFFMPELGVILRLQHLGMGKPAC